MCVCVCVCVCVRTCVCVYKRNFSILYFIQTFNHCEIKKFVYSQNVTYRLNYRFGYTQRIHHRIYAARAHLRRHHIRVPVGICIGIPRGIA